MAATAAWHRSPGYDLRRTRRDLPDLTRSAAHGKINQRFPSNKLYTKSTENTITAKKSHSIPNALVYVTFVLGIFGEELAKMIVFQQPVNSLLGIGLCAGKFVDQLFK